MQNSSEHYLSKLELRPPTTNAKGDVTKPNHALLDLSLRFGNDNHLAEFQVNAGASILNATLEFDGDGGEKVQWKGYARIVKLDQKSPKDEHARPTGTLRLFVAESKTLELCGFWEDAHKVDTHTMISLDLQIAEAKKFDFERNPEQAEPED